MREKGGDQDVGVLIPFASGHDSDVRAVRPHAACYVLIPFASGHDSDVRAVRPHAACYVLIPFASGHDSDDGTADKKIDATVS